LLRSQLGKKFRLHVFAANQIEGHLLIPIVQRYSISLPPALTAIALLVTGTLFGFLGILLAAPITATILLLIRRIYVEEVLGDAPD
jgi:predicted PurR-regulated permease PerM